MIESKFQRREDGAKNSGREEDVARESFQSGRNKENRELSHSMMKQS
jgi:hypothetical protein